MTKKYGIFFNANAGDGKAKQVAQRLAISLSGQNIQPAFITGKDVDDAISAIKKTSNELDAIIVIGGDGTLNLVATAFLQGGKTIPVGLIPSGTVNNFAKTAKIPNDEKSAINIILKGRTKAFNIGSCGDDKAIISSLTFGSLADLSNDVRQEDKRKWGKIVYFWQAMKNLNKSGSQQIEFKSNSFQADYKIWMCLITTSSNVGGHKYIDQPLKGLHATILHNMSLLKSPSYFYFALTGNIRESESLTYFELRDMMITSKNTHHPVQTRIDGDPGPKLPIQLLWHKDFLQVFTD